MEGGRGRTGLKMEGGKGRTGLKMIGGNGRRGLKCGLRFKEGKESFEGGR